MKGAMRADHWFGAFSYTCSCCVWLVRRIFLPLLNLGLPVFTIVTFIKTVVNFGDLTAKKVSCAILASTLKAADCI